MRSGHDGGTHALSNAATGFSGIVALAGATGRNPASSVPRRTGPPTIWSS
ncbi:hypothetical protein P0F65_09395 [Sphingomonas sp. I4]